MDSKTIPMLRQLVTHLDRRQKVQLLLIVPSAIIVAAIDLLFIVSIARLVDVLRLGGGLPLAKLVVVVLSLGWSVAVLKGGLKIWQYNLGGKIWRSLNRLVLDRLLSQSYGYHLVHARAELTTDVLQHLEQLSLQVVLPALLVIGSASTVMLLMVGLLLLAGPLAVLLMGMVASLYGLIAGLLRKPLRNLQERRISCQIEVTTLVLDSLASIRGILLNGSKDEVLRRFDLSLGNIEKSATLSQYLPQMPRIAIEPAGMTIMILMLLLPSIRSSGSSSLPWLAMVTVAMLRLAQPLQELSQAVNQVQGSKPLLRQCTKLLSLSNTNIKSVNYQDTGQRRNKLDWSELRIERIDYIYEGRSGKALKDVSLTLKYGEVLGIIGESGCGKSTLSSIIVGLLSPICGEIRIDGWELEAPKLIEWQRQCAEVSQPMQPLRGTIEQYLWGLMPTGRRDVLDEVIEIVGLRKRIESLPNKIGTSLGDDGLCLSGGERQRLAIARALLIDPGLLVLDEATSGLDQMGEELLLKRLKEKRQRPAIIVISHREATARLCDRIIIMKQGRILEEGTYEGMKCNSKLFSRLMRDSKD